MAHSLGPHTLRILERLMQVLEQGGYSSTYKYAVLLGLVELCVERGYPPESVTTEQLARRVIELYWPQARAFGSRVLVQNAGKQAGIVRLILDHQKARPDLVSPGLAARLDPAGFGALLLEVEWVLIEYPLPRVQKVGSHLDTFLYELTWDESVRRSDFAARGVRRADFDNNVRLLPGVGEALAGMAPLLVPLLRAQWVAKVAALNELPEARLADHLFGVDREALAALGRPLRALQDERCFYCEASLAAQKVEVDHFLPWSRYPDNGLDNLVLAHGPCNRDKLHFLADLPFAERWARRSRERDGELEALANAHRWVRDRERTFGVVAGVYRGLPEGVRLWRGLSDLRLLGPTDLPALHAFGSALLAPVALPAP